MAKGQKKGNRELKKPKQEKKMPVAAPSVFAAPPGKKRLAGR